MTQGLVKAENRRKVSSRSEAGLSALLMVVVCAGALTLFSADAAIAGGIITRIALPLRMLTLVALATLLLRWADESWGSVGLRRPRSLWRTASLVIGGYVAVTALSIITQGYLLPSLGIAHRTPAMFSGLRGDTMEYLYWLLPITWGSAAFGEEMIFRGFLQSRLCAWFGLLPAAQWIAVFVQAGIFGALHSYLGAGGALLAAVMGLVLGVTYTLGGRNLWACIVLHGLIDTTAVTTLYLGAVPAAH